jgi:hypothetical protein
MIVKTLQTIVSGSHLCSCQHCNTLNRRSGARLSPQTTGKAGPTMKSASKAVFDALGLENGFHMVAHFIGSHGKWFNLSDSGKVHAPGRGREDAEIPARQAPSDKDIRHSTITSASHRVSQRLLYATEVVFRLSRR